MSSFMKRFDDIEEHGTNDPKKRKRDDDIPEFFGRDTICLPVLLKGHKTLRPISIDRNHIVSVYPTSNPDDRDDGYWYRLQTSAGDSFLIYTCNDWYDFVRKVHPDCSMNDDSDSYSSDQDTESSNEQEMSSDEGTFDADIA